MAAIVILTIQSIVPKLIYGTVSTNTTNTTSSTTANATGTKHNFAINTSGNEAVNAYQAKVPFKQFIAKNIGHIGVRSLIASEISAVNTFCPDVKTAFGNILTCDNYIALAKIACELDNKISNACVAPVIKQYVEQRQLTDKQLNLLAYQRLASTLSVINSQLPHDNVVQLYMPGA